MEQATESRAASPEEISEVERPPAASLQVEERAEVPRFRTLADLYAERGFFENRMAETTWDEYRSFTWAAGTVLTDLNPVRREGLPLGYDRCWLYPVLPQTGVDSATTAVQFLREQSHAGRHAVIRPLTDHVHQAGDEHDGRVPVAAAQPGSHGVERHPAHPCRATAVPIAGRAGS